MALYFQNSAEEMERKKERIMLMSLQRRQRADEERARADAAAAARKSREEAAMELKAARKEEQAKRRQAILQQYKLKKAIEEAEREVYQFLSSHSVRNYFIFKFCDYLGGNYVILLQSVSIEFYCAALYSGRFGSSGRIATRV